MRATWRQLGAALVTIGLLSTGCSSGSDDSRAPSEEDSEPPRGSTDAPTQGQGDIVLPASVLEPLVEAVPELTLAPLPDLRLADGLTPPTNRWFSGLVFGEEPQPVFPLPLAFSVDDTSFGAGLPQIVTSATNIVGSHQQDVNVEVADAASTVVSDYDDASITLETRNGEGRALGRTTVAQGSPFISHVATTEVSLSTSITFTGSGDVAVADTSTGQWGVRLHGATLEGDTLTLSEGDAVVFFPVPADGEVDAMAEHAVPITGVSASYAVGEDAVTTTLDYDTSGGTTAFGVLPHQSSAVTPDCRLGSFPTVYGTLTMCAGSALAWSAPRRSATAALDLSSISDADRKDLARQVESDVADLPDPPADTYFGGKWAYRTAQLVTIADQVGAEAAASRARTELTDLLREWAQPDGCVERTERCFGYDPDWKGVVGQAPAFGSELFNDHHFHYGYFLYAAGVLAADSPGLVEELTPVMNLLAGDIAAGSDSGITPKWRAFDAYASHSWAAGTSDFADGNNQESSSEAVTAWAGLLLWAQAAGDEGLQLQASWMLSSEAHAARTYWTDFDTSDSVYEGFEHGAMGINWGGKRDYATWFSPEPSAILGIQLIPMSPSSGYLAGDAARITANVEEAGDGPLSDYAVMYAGLAGTAEAREALARTRSLPDDAIDQGNSRSYMYAYLMALASAT